ncbi:MAG: YebC/PmpR family DNA-binding transcriptional regulator [Ilumatobacteraceae bacterium]
MSGHSKWATIKHKKGAADAKRGKLFAKLARQIEVSARGGGGDPDMNPSLRQAVQKAKAAQMTNDAIDRAIAARVRAAPTRTRTSPTRDTRRWGRAAHRRADRQPQPHQRRHPFGLTRMGGSMAEPEPSAGSSAAAWHHPDRGQLGVDEDELMMAAPRPAPTTSRTSAMRGRSRSATSSDTFDVKDAIEAAGYTIMSADTPMVSDNLVPVTSVEDAKKILRIMEAIETTWTTSRTSTPIPDIADDVMEAAAG